MKTGIIEKIKDEVTCLDYMARMHGVSVRPGGRCRSFRSDATNPSSLLVNARDWHDFGVGSGGDVIDMCAQDRFNGSKGAAIAFLAENWHLGVTESIPDFEFKFDRYRNVLDLAVEYWHSCLTDDRRAYFHNRGITDETINTLKLGWTANAMPYCQQRGITPEEYVASGCNAFISRYSIPYMHNGHVSYIIARISDPSSCDHPDAKYEKLFRNDLSEHPIWGVDSLRREGTVYIAEGAFDAISFWQEGFPVVSAITGAFSADQKKDLIPMLRGRDVVICMDYDPVTKAGQKFTENLASELFEAGIHVSACLLQGGENKVDISELYAKAPSRKTLEDLSKLTQDWPTVVIARLAAIPGETERKKRLVAFLRRCSSSFDWPTVCQYVAAAEKTGAWDSVWLKETKKTLNTPPAEIEVVDKLREEQEFCFHPALGWFQWSGSVWQRVDELCIKQKISSVYGRHQTNRNVDSAAHLARVHLMHDQLFDQDKHLLNMTNGMLNVETQELLPHARDYYSSIQLPYEYQPDASCPQWERFLDDVTNGEEDQQRLVQQMFGYCLTKDARYQRCFCLVGNGSNGKSVLLSVLEAMVSAANCSHVEIAYLHSDFQRIKLLNSMVNVCNDMRSDVAGSESFLKACVAGDDISACYKGKDFVDFKPYAKFVFAVNEIPTARDVGYGFRRRFCFVNFPLCYTDFPNNDNPNERKRDPEILSRLLTELPGILNWALVGLRDLRGLGRFVNTTHQEDMDLMLARISDTILGYFEECWTQDGLIFTTPEFHSANLTAGEFKLKGELYASYSEWCQSRGYHALASNTFWSKAQNIWPYERRHSISGRCVKFDSQYFDPRRQIK